MSRDFQNRIDQCFEKAKREQRAALLCFLTAGDPNFKKSLDFALALANSGVDLLELGMPYSDPMADGPVIQRASQRALAAGMTLKKVLEFVGKLRKKSEIPVLLMGYLNPILAYGIQEFARDLKKAGGDGVLIVDLTPEESGEFHRLLQEQNLHQIFLLAPTSDTKRMRQVTRFASGFIYYVSLEGVTGAQLKPQKSIKQSVHAQLAEIRKISDLPVAVGFGVRDVKQVQALSEVADGVVVGSALIEALEKNKNRSLKAGPLKLVRSLQKGLYK